jgi:hypothetical protein
MTLRGWTQRELKGGRAPVLGQIGRISASMRLFGSTLSNFGGMHLHVKNCIQERFKIVLFLFWHRDLVLGGCYVLVCLRCCVLQSSGCSAHSNGGAKVTLAMCLCAGSCILHTMVLSAIELQRIPTWMCFPACINF